ncbi:MAG: NAD(P)-binding domain-containing protein [Phycisphaerales bacterium]
MDTLEHVRLVVIGGGVMGRAIVEGGLRAGVLDAAAVVVAEPDARRRTDFESLGVGVAATGVEALTRPERTVRVTGRTAGSWC